MVTQVVPAQIINDHHDNVWRGRGSNARCGNGTAAQQQRAAGGAKHAKVVHRGAFWSNFRGNHISGRMFESKFEPITITALARFCICVAAVCLLVLTMSYQPISTSIGNTGGMNTSQLSQGEVLAFKASYHDQKESGRWINYIVKYYAESDSIEIIEEKSRKQKSSSFCCFLKKNTQQM
jgi:hypothetical protein